MFYLGKTMWRLCRPVAVALLFGSAANVGWASGPEALKLCSSQGAGHIELGVVQTKDDLSADPSKLNSGMNGTAGFCLAHWVRHLALDQRAIWASPFRLRSQDRKDTNWLLPLGVGTLVLLAADQDILRHVGNSPLAYSGSLGNYGLAGMFAGTASLYLRGTSTDSSHSRESGLLAGQALANSLIVGEALKLVFQRPRPNAPNAGSFGAGGASFPSVHSLAAWSMASVIAREYPGPLTKLLVYGAATGISFSRITAREHFPSDVVVGSTLGYLIGGHVYRAHHDPELPGASQSAYEESKPARPRTAAELGSPFVPLDSWVYAGFDRLTALGYTPSAFADLRPWTRMECARLIADAGVELDSNDDQRSEAYRLYQALEAEFSTELERFHGSGTSEVLVDSLYTRYSGIAGTPLDDSYHFGQTLFNDFGRPYGQGSNLVSGASALGSAGPVAFYIRGEYQHAGALPAYSQAVQQLIGTVDVTPPQLPIHTSAINQFSFLDAYAVWNFKTIQISAGRQSLWWGPGKGGPPNFSDNAQPMDMLRLTNPSPWNLPSFFHWLGPLRGEFFFGLMDGHHYPANPAIDGQKISFKPTPNLEFGFSRTIVFRPVTLHMFWRGFISVGDNKTTIPGSAADVGDRRGGFDFSYRIPGLRQWLVLYNDGMTDDDPSPLRSPQRSLMNPGIYLPQIPRIPKLDFRAEAVWSDPPALSNWGGHFFYYNGAYHDSYTNDGQLLGSWVGREGHGLQLWSTYWLSARSPLQLGYRAAHVDRNFIPAGGSITDFFARVTLPLNHEMEIATFLQYEHWTFPILAPLAGPNTVASIELTYHPKWRKVLNAQ